MVKRRFAQPGEDRLDHLGGIDPHGRVVQRHSQQFCGRIPLPDLGAQSGYADQFVTGFPSLLT
jgi:hypothetical protein